MPIEGAGTANLIRACEPGDFAQILRVINDAAQVYCGVIPQDCWHEPYMSADELRREIAAGVQFSGVEQAGILVAVMGIQDVKDVTLVRHAYVAGAKRRTGLGAGLLAHLRSLTNRPTLVGTWAAARWAIAFYQKHGYRLVAGAEHAVLLRRYWTVSGRQIETSVVLADERWRSGQSVERKTQ
jgi:N-acetylglutamate synthase-like GNAT family acetyltransferase